MTDQECLSIQKRLVLQRGSIEAQGIELAKQIIEAFEDPQKWPMTDSARIALLKDLYSTAKKLRSNSDVMKST